MDKMIEVRYAGVVVGRTAIIRELDTRGLFLGITEPMPVGTPIVLRIDNRAGGEDVAGKVEIVSESQELAHAGMRVRFADSSAAALFGTPVEAPPEPPQPEPPVEVRAVAADAAPAATVGRDPAAPDAAAGTAQSGHRRIVVDASTEKASDANAPESVADAAGDLSMPTTDETGRITAPDPSAFGGGKKGRRNRRR